MIDFTTLLLSLITGIFSILSIVLPVMINARMKDKAAAETLATAVKNSLGAMAQAAVAEVTTIHPSVSLPALILPAKLGVGVQYVLDHAGDEAKRFGITAQAISDKITAQIGLLALQKAPVVFTSASPPLPVVTVPPFQSIAAGGRA